MGIYTPFKSAIFIRFKISINSEKLDKKEVKLGSSDSPWWRWTNS